jgi:hypothetical protein
VEDTAALEKMHDELELEEEREEEMVVEKAFLDSGGVWEEANRGKGSKSGMDVDFESLEEDEEDVIPDSEDESSERLTQDKP